MGDKSNNLAEITTLLKELPQFAMILKKWEQASKMRQWINEFKGQLSIKQEK